MNVIKEMYLYEIFNDKELNILSRRIYIKSTIIEGKVCYHFSNSYKLETDKAYADLLEIDMKSYQQIIYANCYIYDQRRTMLFLNKQEAEKKKELLIYLLINKYKKATLANDAMLYLMEKGRRSNE